ncbi:hypothetical protein F542_16380 [Bibersteinia trehalosi USDA-ARS-USMARC-188]|uniref:Uncharacterized protein n=2 Tax=Bibersteinia trehalosi TaxID=47735 RepID=A0A4V7IBP6_BIBTR|nr:hypothetical protein WQG_5670 [Bibersteinia trehalosi USDA-ARS-USMARC-192]AHG82352.1 hypothetical protein F542_16380 [Bibersteinia trehalosi USDA-ARS-USMARC-188]AHG84668.1 hypothetical protein F543_18080 [Bibersteinia trehalosi USDA-ARS-USMARC-189]
MKKRQKIAQNFCIIFSYQYQMTVFLSFKCKRSNFADFLQNSTACIVSEYYQL